MPEVRTGDVYLVRDERISLLPDSDRNIHSERRPFVILSNNQKNSQQNWPVVLGCPISSSTKYRTEYDFKLGHGEAGVTKKCWITVPALQRLLKEDLEDKQGALDASQLEEVQAAVLDYMGLLSDS